MAQLVRSVGYVETYSPPPSAQQRASAFSGPLGPGLAHLAVAGWGRVLGNGIRRVAIDRRTAGLDASASRGPPVSKRRCAALAYFNNLTSVFPGAPITVNKLITNPFRNSQVVSTSYFGRTRGWHGPHDALGLWDRWLGSDRTQLLATIGKPLKPFTVSNKRQIPKEELDILRRLLADRDLR